MIRWVIGLGNPGPEYQDTRHNMGVRFIHGLVAAYGHGGVRLSSHQKHHGALAKLTIVGHVLHVMVPEVYMNHSGLPVSSVVRYYRLRPDQVLIVHDDLDLPVGTLRLKMQGGHGGHNGLRDIISALGTSHFPRLRVGIGHPGCRSQVSGYVLGVPSSEDMHGMDQAIALGISALPMLLKGDQDRAMRCMRR